MALGSKRGNDHPEWPYWGVMLRLEACVDLAEAFLRIFFANRVPSWGLRVRIKEMEWLAKRRDGCKYPYRFRKDK